MKTTREIVHKLNELIAEAETIHQSLLYTMESGAFIELNNHFKRGIGQLKAARASFIATGEMGRAA